jgi:hypothetical protein
MRYSRREIGKVALAALPAAALLERPLAVLGQSKPNSVVSGVNLGTITYSYRSIPDQRAEAILRYVVDSGMRKNRWKMPATIELEYEVPTSSDAVREVAKCLEFCKRALA